MTRALLDVNVLVALLDVEHTHHDRAAAWLDDEIGHGWASCAITENGFVRVMSQPRYSSPVAPAAAAARLERAMAASFHERWDCTVRLTDDDAVDVEKLHGPRQVTDAYLLALAVAHGGRFATLDEAVPVSAVPGAGRDSLVIV